MILARDFSGGGLTLAAGWEYAAIDTTEVNTTVEFNWNMYGTAIGYAVLNWDMDAGGELILQAIESDFTINWIYQTDSAIPARNLMKILPN